MIKNFLSKLISAYYIMFLMVLFAASSAASTIGGSFSVSGGAEPIILTPSNIIDLNLFNGIARTGGPIAARTNLFPQEKYTFKFNASDTARYEQLSRITVKMFYSTEREFTKDMVFGSGVFGSGVTLETDGSGLNFVWEWTLDGTNVNSGIVYASGLDSGISSWTRDLSYLVAPDDAFMTNSGTESIDFDFEIPIQPSKIAKFAGRNWHIAVLVEKNNNDYGNAGFNILSDFGMNWYGEILLDSPERIVWPLPEQDFLGDETLNPDNNVRFGSPFDDPLNKTSLMVRYISNGNYEKTIQSSGNTWVSDATNPLANGDPFTATLVGRDPSSPQEMAIRFNESGLTNLASSTKFLTDQSTLIREKSLFTSSPETGDEYFYQLFVSLAPEFQNGTYKGVINLGLRDPFYVILNVDNDELYAGTPFARLSQTFSTVQAAADKAIVDATSGQTIRLLREIDANIFIPMGTTTGLNVGAGLNYTSDRSMLTVDFDSFQINGNVIVSGIGNIDSTLIFSGFGTINGDLTIDGRRLDVQSNAEVLGNTLIYNTSLGSYTISEFHSGDIIVGNNNQGRTRIVSLNERVQPKVVIDTIERIFLEGKFDRVTFVQNSTAFDFDGHARFESATVKEVFVNENAELYFDSGSSVTSGFTVASSKTARVYLETGNLPNQGSSGDIDLVRFLDQNVVNLSNSSVHSSLQDAINEASNGHTLIVREYINTETITIDKPIRIEGIQRDYSPLERFETSNKAPRFRNRGESVITNLMTINSDDVILNGLKFDLASGQQLSIKGDNATLTHLWVTKNHVINGLENAVTIESVSGLLIQDSAFMDILDRVTVTKQPAVNYNRHGILMSGVLENITIRDSHFNDIDGKHIGVTGTSLNNLLLTNNTHHRSLDGNADNDAIMYFETTTFENGLVSGITVTDPFIRTVVLKTLDNNARFENITVSNVTVGGTDTNQLLSNVAVINDKNNSIFSGIQIIENSFEAIFGDEQNGILFDNTGSNATFENVVISNNTLLGGTNSTSFSNRRFIYLNQRAGSNDTVTWNNLLISDNSINENVNAAIELSISSNQSATFNNIRIIDNIIDNRIISNYRGLYVKSSSPNVSVQNFVVESNSFIITSTGGKAIDLSFTDSTNVRGNGADIIDLTISGNTILNTDRGIEINASNGSPVFRLINIANNSITGSDSTKTGSSISSLFAIYLDGRENSQWDDVTISANSELNGQTAGIQVTAGDNSLWKDIKITNNSGLIGSTDAGRGIRFGVSGTATIDKTSILDNQDIRGNDQGILIESASGTPVFTNYIEILRNGLISGNDNGQGIFVDLKGTPTVAPITVSGNTVINGGSNAIDFSSSGDINVNFTIQNNPTISGVSSGIRVNAGGASSWDGTILNNANITGGTGSAIDVAAPTTASIEYLIKDNNNIVGGSNGIRLNSAAASTWSGLIQNNNLNGSGDRGIFVDYHSSTVNSGLQILNNSIAYEIGLLSDSFDIDTISNVRNNTFTSTKWYIKDVHPDLDAYINIRSGLSGVTNNIYANAFISFSNDRDPNGIRPANQFNVWNETRFYGFLADVTNNDNAQFQIAVDNVLTKENDQIRLANTPDTGINDGVFKVSEFDGTASQSGYFWRGYSFKLDVDTVVTDLIGGFTSGTGGRMGIYSASLYGNGNALRPSALLGFVELTGTTREQVVPLSTPITLQANTWYYIAQGSTNGSSSHYAVGDINVSNMISNSIISAWGPVNGTQSHYWNQGDETHIINSTPNTDSTKPAIGFLYEGGIQFDLSNIEVNTSGIRIFSNPTDSNGTVNRAQVRNIPHSGVTVQSGVIFNITAPGVTIEYLSFQHGHDNYELDETNGYGVVQVQASDATLSGLAFVSEKFQSLFAVAVVTDSNRTGEINNTLIQSIEIGSGTSNASYLGGIGLLTFSGTEKITNVTIQSGFIQTSGSSEAIGVLLLGNTLHQISGVSIIGNTLNTNVDGITAVGSGSANVSIENNSFSNNGTHLKDLSSPPTFTSLRNEILTGNGNTFGPAVDVNAYVFDALVVGNTITSARQDFTNVEKLEAYETLQDAIDDAEEGQTIKVRSDATFSDDELNVSFNGTLIVNVSGLTITSVNPPNFANLHNTHNSDIPIMDLRASGITIQSIQLTRNSGIVSSSGSAAVLINNSFITISGVSFTSTNGFELVYLEDLLYSNTTLSDGNPSIKATATTRKWGWNGFAIKISSGVYATSITTGVSNARSGDLTLFNDSTIPPGLFQAAIFRAFEDSQGIVIASGIKELVEGTVVNVTSLISINSNPTVQEFAAPVYLEPGWYYIAYGASGQHENEEISPITGLVANSSDLVNILVNDNTFISDVYSYEQTIHGSLRNYIELRWYDFNTPNFSTASALADANSVPNTISTGLSGSVIPVLGFSVSNIVEAVSTELDNAMSAISYNNSGVQVTSGIVITNNQFEGTWLSMIEFTNTLDSGVIEATISNNTASQLTRFNAKFANSTSGIILMNAFDDILVRLDAFDTVNISGNVYGSDSINKTLNPVFDRLSFDSLASTVTTANGLNSGLYTSGTWQLVINALALPERTNTDNQTKLAQLTAALSGLVFQTSFDALEAEVNFSSGLLESDFTNSTFTTFSGVFATSSGILNTHDLTSVTNSGILDATSGLINAMIQLEFDSEATLSGLVNITTSGLDTSNFTDPAGFVTARASGIELLEQIRTSGVKAFYEGAFVVSNSVVSGLSTDLQTRLDALVFNNFSGLLDEINLVSGLVESNFEADEWPAFDIARNSGLTIKTNVTNSGALAFFDSVALTSGTILNVTNAMQTARADLVFSGFEVLSGLVNATTSGLTEANYTAVTFDPFTIVRDSGILIVDAVRTSGALAVFETNPLSSGVITFITNELTTRFNDLGFDGLEELSGLVNITTSGLVESDHTTDTWSIFNAARTSGIGILDAVRTSGAVAVFDGSPVTTSVINTASSDLQAAFSGLVLQTSFTALEAEINFSSGLLESDFTNSSFTNFSGVFATSSGILNTHNLTSVTNSGVLDATSGLINAMIQLEFISEVTLSGIVNETVVLDASNFSNSDAFVIARSSGVELLAQISASGVKAFYENDFVRLNEIVSGLASLLQTEVSGLTFGGLPADLSGFNVILNLDESNFEANEWTAFDVARSSGAAILSAIDSSGAFATFDGTALTSGVTSSVTSAIESTRDALIFKGITSLNELVNVTTLGFDLNNFTAATWNAFNIARTSGIIMTHEVEFDGALAHYPNQSGSLVTSGLISQVQFDLQTAFDNLVFEGQVALSGLVNTTTSGLDQSNYTVATWTPFNTARTSGINILNAITASGAVAQVDGVDVSSSISAVDEALTTSFINLVFEGQVTLSELVAQVTPLDASNFTDSTSFVAARTSGIAIIDAITASGAVAEFDGARVTANLISTTIQQINDAVGILVFEGINNLSGLVNTTTSGLDESNFTPDTWTTFNNARTSGLAVLNEVITSGALAVFEGTPLSSGVITQVTNTLNTATSGLVFVNQALLLDLVNEVSGLLESNFETAEWPAFDIARTSGLDIQTTINNDRGLATFDGTPLSSGVIEDVFQALTQATDALRFSGLESLSGLVNITTSGLDESNFTVDTWTTFNNARTSGLAILSEVTSSGALALFEGVPLSSGVITQVTNNLQVAYDELDFQGFERFSTLLLYASGLVEEDYETGSFATTGLDDAIVAGKEIYNEVVNSGVLASTIEGDPVTSGLIITTANQLETGLLSIRLSGLQTLSGLVNVTTSGLVESEYTANEWTALQEARTSGVLVIEQITSSGALGLFEGEFITSGVLTTLIDTIENRFAALQFAAFADLQQTLFDTSGIIENSGLYTTESFNTFEVAYQSGLLIETVLNSGVFAQVNGIVVTNQVIIDINQAIITASGNLIVQEVFLTMASQITEEESEYFINDASGLIALQEYVNRGSGTTNLTFKLVNDISLSGINWIPIGDGLGTESSSVFNEFTGTFDGQNFTISNLYSSGLTDSAFAGLFGVVESSGLLQNFTLSGVSIVHVDNALPGVGTVAGTVLNNAAISGVTVTGNVFINAPASVDVGGFMGYSESENINFSSINAKSLHLIGGSFVGGFVGSNNGVISLSDLIVEQSLVISGISEVGGFVGYNEGTISSSTLQVDQNLSISGVLAVGGFVGKNNSSGEISSTQFNASTVEMFAQIGLLANAIAGGFVGENYGLINDVVYQSTNLNITSSGFQVGGFVGYNDGTIASGVIQVTQTISVKGADTIGAFVGSNSGLIQNLSVTADSLNVTATKIGQYSDVGGFAGYNGGDIINSLISANNINITGEDYVAGFVGFNDGIITSGNLQVSSTLSLSGLTNIGGFAGYNFGDISDSSIRSTMLSINAQGIGVGGFVGYNAGDISSNNLQVDNLLSLSGLYGVGGFAGLNYEKISEIQFDALNVMIETIGDNNFIAQAGGFVGSNDGMIENISYRTTDIFIDAKGMSVGGFAGSQLSNGTTQLIQFDSSGVVINTVGSPNQSRVGGFIGEAANETQITNINFVANSIVINADKNLVGGFIGQLNASEIKNVQMIVINEIEISSSESVGVFAGGGSNANLSPIISGVYVIHDISKVTITGTTTGYLIGRIPYFVAESSTTNTLTLNNVFYNSGLQSNGSWIQATAVRDSDYWYDSFDSESVIPLSEVTSGVLMSIINSDDVFIAADANQFPILKATTNQTIVINRQRLIDITWLASE